MCASVLRFQGAAYRTITPTKKDLNNEKHFLNSQRKRLKRARIQCLFTSKALEKLRIGVVIRMRRLSYDYAENKSEKDKTVFGQNFVFVRFVTFLLRGAEALILFEFILILN